MSQTTYNTDPRTGRAGMVVSQSSETQYRSAVSTAAVSAGACLVFDTTADKCKKATTEANDDSTLGFAVWQSSKMPASPEYATKEMVPVLRKGTIWLSVAAGVAYGKLYRVKSAVDGKAAGDLVGTVGATGAEYIEVKGVKVLTATNGDGLCLVEVNLPA